MKFLANIFWLAAWAHSALALEFKGANVLDLSHGVGIEVEVRFDSTTLIFEYSYSLSNPKVNSGQLRKFSLDVSNPPGSQEFASGGLGNDSHFDRETMTEMMLAGSIRIFSLSVRSPERWLGRIGLDQRLSWGALGTGRVNPGSRLPGFTLRTRVPPEFNSFIAEPPLDVDKLPEDQFGAETAGKGAVANTRALMELLKVKGQTVGPRPPSSLNPFDLVGRLISLKHDARSQGWIFGPGADGIAKSLDAKLEAAKGAVDRGNKGAAIAQLEAFLKEVESQRGKHLNDNAYFLLRVNAEFIIAKLTP